MVRSSIQETEGKGNARFRIPNSSTGAGGYPSLCKDLGDVYFLT